MGVFFCSGWKSLKKISCYIYNKIKYPNLLQLSIFQAICWKERFIILLSLCATNPFCCSLEATGRSWIAPDLGICTNSFTQITSFLHGAPQTGQCLLFAWSSGTPGFPVSSTVQTHLKSSRKETSWLHSSELGAQEPSPHPVTISPLWVRKIIGHITTMASPRLGWAVGSSGRAGGVGRKLWKMCEKEGENGSENAFSCTWQPSIEEKNKNSKTVRN